MTSSDTRTAGGEASAVWLLFLFCTMSLLVYVDRGAIGSNGVNYGDPEGGHPGLQRTFDLSDFQSGLIPSAFLVGLMVASVAFAEASKHAAPFRLVGVGLAAWLLSLAGCSSSWSFPSFLVCRMAVGAGEASFVNLAQPFINDYAPPRWRTLWLAIYIETIPVGFALGFAFGGVAGTALGWRAVFALEALAMLPFALYCLLAPAVPLRLGPDRPQAARGVSLKESLVEIARDAARCWRLPVYPWVVAGYTLHTGCVGAMSFWGPQVASQLFEVPRVDADLAFAVLTVGTGVLGTLAGGIVLDMWGRTVHRASMMCAVSALAAAALVMLSLQPSLAASFPHFVALFGVAELAIFSIMGPVTGLTQWTVDEDLRPLAIAMVTVFIHLLGDVPSPPLLGWLHDRVTQNWRVVFCLNAGLLVASSLCFLGAAWASRPRPAAVQPADGRVPLLTSDPQHEANGCSEAEPLAPGAAAAAGPPCAG